jgi:hypothetical protein
VHVQHATGQAKFWLEPVVEFAHNYGLGHRQISAAFRLLKENEDERFPLVSRALPVAPVRPLRRRSGKTSPSSRRPALG